MRYLLDTNILSAHIRRPGGMAHRFIQHTGRLWMPSIVLGELYAGAYMLSTPDRILEGIESLLMDIPVVPFDAECAVEFGRLRGELKKKGAPVNPVDLQIAAVAVRHGFTLVTNNTRDFQQVPGLLLDDWLPA